LRVKRALLFDRTFVSVIGGLAAARLNARRGSS
jgi:hypothetical protein